MQQVRDGDAAIAALQGGATELAVRGLGEDAAQFAAALSKATHLTTLCLCGNAIGATGAETLAQVLPETQLATLDLGSNRIDTVGTTALARALPRVTHLTILGLGSNRIGDAGALALARVLPQTNLTTLDLGYNRIGDTGAQALAHVLPATQLAKLGLHNNRIGATGAQALALTLPQAKQLAVLDLGGNSIIDAGTKALAQVLPQATQLTTLGLGYNRIGTAGATALAQILPQATRLTTLNLGGNSINDAGCQAMAQVLPQTKLTTLYLGGNGIGNIGAHALAQGLPQTKLTTLHLGSNSISDTGAQWLALALPAKLTTLYLGSNLIGAAGAQALAQALPPKLTTLSLSCNGIGAAGAQALAQVLPQTNLTTLLLGSNSIGAAGAQALAQVLPQTQLTMLDLDNNSIGDAGAQALAQVLPQTRLTTLNLGRDSIGDAIMQEVKTVLQESSAGPPMDDGPRSATIGTAQTNLHPIARLATDQSIFATVDATKQAIDTSSVHVANLEDAIAQAPAHLGLTKGLVFAINELCNTVEQLGTSVPTAEQSQRGSRWRQLVEQRDRCRDRVIALAKDFAYAPPPPDVSQTRELVDLLDQADMPREVRFPRKSSTPTPHSPINPPEHLVATIASSLSLGKAARDLEDNTCLLVADASPQRSALLDRKRTLLARDQTSKEAFDAKGALPESVPEFLSNQKALAARRGRIKADLKRLTCLRRRRLELQGLEDKARARLRMLDLESAPKREIDAATIELNHISTTELPKHFRQEESIVLGLRELATAVHSATSADDSGFAFDFPEAEVEAHEARTGRVGQIGTPSQELNEVRHALAQAKLLLPGRKLADFEPRDEQHQVPHRHTVMRRLRGTAYPVLKVLKVFAVGDVQRGPPCHVRRQAPR